MSEYGDQEPNETTRRLGVPWEETLNPASASSDAAPGGTQPAVPPAGSAQPTPQSSWTGQPQSAPTWQWDPMQARLPQQPQQPAFYPPPPYGAWSYPPQAPVAVAGGVRGLSRRSKIASGAAAVLLVGGAAAGGAAFGFAHGSPVSSASGIAGQTTPGSSPSQGQQQSNPPYGGLGSGSGSKKDGRASRFSAPGHASASQSIGVVDIDTRLKYEGARAAGTGMILTANGEVLTNNHVVEGATKVRVTVVSTGKRYTATVVGTDKVDDVAVLQLSGASGLSTVRTDSSAPSVGEAVTAVGNAMGAGGVPSAAKGTVTAVDRSITTQNEGGVDGERLSGLIQVDAMVVSGDSGGPLYSSNGEVIGMDTAASSSPAQSTGFAIPITKALGIASQVENGDAGGNITLGTPAFLGVQFPTNVFGQSGNGAVVGAVLPKTPAQRAGLVAGDRITRVNSTAVTSGEQLHTVLTQFKAGQTVSVTWLDTQGGSHTASVRLIAGPAE
jgi:S1-C subfamily serine protease